MSIAAAVEEPTMSPFYCTWMSFLHCVFSNGSSKVANQSFTGEYCAAIEEPMSPLARISLESKWERLNENQNKSGWKVGGKG